MIELLILAIALSMDAFAVSIGLGSKQLPKPHQLAIKAAFYFGIFQGLMPLIGYLAGKSVIGWIEGYASWIAAALLTLIALKMIYESLQEGVEEEIAKITHRVMLILAIATSIDAMAAGFTLNLMSVDPLLACLIIAAVTALFSYAGVLVGKKTGSWLESKAEILGGAILLLIAAKIVLVG